MAVFYQWQIRAIDKGTSTIVCKTHLEHFKLTNAWILCDKKRVDSSKVKFFDAMVTSVVCFAAGHRKLFVGELQKPAVHRQKLLRRMVGPADVNWNGPWCEFLHAWHIRLEQQPECNGFESWSHRYWRKSGNLQTISRCCQVNVPPL